MKNWWQRYWALVRWSIWYWRERRHAAEPNPHEHRLTRAAEDADCAGQEDVAAVAERRVLAAL